MSGRYFPPHTRARTQGGQLGILTATVGEGLFLATLHLCDLRLQFLRTEAQDGGEAGLGFTLLLSNMTLSLILNFRSPSPSLGLRSGRGGRLGFQTHLDLMMGVMVAAIAEGDCPSLEWTESPSREVCVRRQEAALSPRLSPSPSQSAVGSL